MRDVRAKTVTHDKNEAEKIRKAAIRAETKAKKDQEALDRKTVKALRQLGRNYRSNSRRTRCGRSRSKLCGVLFMLELNNRAGMATLRCTRRRGVQH